MIFIVHIILLSFIQLIKLNIYPSSKTLIAGLIAQWALLKVSMEYVNFAEVFLPDLASKFSKHVGINNYTIN